MVSQLLVFPRQPLSIERPSAEQPNRQRCPPPGLLTPGAARGTLPRYTRKIPGCFRLDSASCSYSPKAAVVRLQP